MVIGKRRFIKSAGVGAMVCAVMTTAGCRLKDAADAFRGKSAASAPEIILKLHGSNTIGAKIAPALAKAYLLHIGADTVREISTGAEEALVVGLFNKREKAVEIWSHGSNTGFNDLAWGKCDIGMSSKPIEDQDVQRLAALGDMRSPLNEHIIGLDGIAIIVHPSNPLAQISVETLAGIFSGKIRDWKQLNAGLAGPIAFYTRDKNSGTFDLFRHNVLGPQAMGEKAVVSESNDQTAAAVAGNPLAIGYVPVGALQGVKALAVGSGEGSALNPTKLNVVTEDYPLSRRLFLYSPARMDNPHAKAFIDFAQGEDGQSALEQAGFIAQVLRLCKPDVPENAPAGYVSETKGALRLALDFRFRSGSSELDNKARQDMDRFARFLDQEHLHPCRIKLFGFCDNQGSAKRNAILSAQRARIVADELRGRFHLETAAVRGMGSKLPIASNESELGREKNRRIEVWMECSSEVAAAEVP